MGCKAVPQGMRVDALIQSRAHGCLLHGIPYAFGCYGDVDVGMSAFTGEQVSFRLGVSPRASSCEVPVVASG